MIWYVLIVILFISFNLGYFFTVPINKPKTIKTQICAGLFVVVISLLAFIMIALILLVIKGV